MKLVAVAAALAVLAGCATPPEPKKAEAPAPAPAAPAPVAKAAPAPAPVPKVDPAVAALEAAKKRLASVEPAVYFDFDKFDIKKEYHGVLSAFGNYMALDKNAKVVIEGNADERGTVEYNLALGQKRAEAVSIGLQALGANPANIEAISNGEEKPRNKARSETAFAENRRADLIVR
ncbi:MAG: OmpA family protein [Burkholderiaceae bacterium]